MGSTCLLFRYLQVKDLQKIKTIEKIHNINLESDLTLSKTNL